MVRPAVRLAMQIKVTVCQLHDDPAKLESDWTGLMAHVRAEESNLVLLPEMPFSPWFATSRTFDPAVWTAAIAAHTAWEARLRDLAPVFDAQVGFLICTELWYFEQARLYGREGVHLLVTPRLTGGATLDKWLVGGRAAAIAAGAFGLSSNRFDKSDAYGGQGWIVGPDGEVLGLTSASEPFVSARIDLEVAEKAKSTYPRYAISGSLPVTPL
jgi:N-carbamoylputrescine amidase